MSGPKEAARPASPEDFLRRALEAPDAPSRARWAQRGLALDSADLDPDTQVLLLRQLYRAHVESRRFRKAADVAAQMATIGPLADIAHHDHARALEALGETREAIGVQRRAARVAPATRRSFHFWSLATLQHFHGDVTGALRSLERAERWAHRDRAMIRAHHAYVRLSAGIAVPELEQRIADLQRSPAREGYGQWLLGMIAREIGDARKAAVHLRAFMRRHAGADESTSITLREELRRARVALAEIESD